MVVKEGVDYAMVSLDGGAHGRHRTLGLERAAPFIGESL